MNEQQDEVVENVDKGGLLVLRRDLPKAKEPLKHGGVLLSLLEPTPKAYFEDDRLENLRKNSFLEGENDVYMGGPLDQSKSNQAIKSPRT